MVIYIVCKPCINVNPTCRFNFRGPILEMLSLSVASCLPTIVNKQGLTLINPGLILKTNRGALFIDLNLPPQFEIHPKMSQEQTRATVHDVLIG